MNVFNSNKISDKYNDDVDFIVQKVNEYKYKLVELEKLEEKINKRISDANEELEALHIEMKKIKEASNHLVDLIGEYDRMRNIWNTLILGYFSEEEIKCLNK